MASIVDVQHVSKEFGATRAVDDVSFEIRGGEIFGLLGPNGAGKTTMIRMILDLFKPDSGTIAVFGKPIAEQDKARIGYLPEERGLYKNVSVIDCLSYLASLKGLHRSDARRRAMDYLERVDLGGVAKKKVKELSKGMQQKVQLGVALLHEPALIIVDEPFYGLDPVNTRLVKDMLRAGRDRGAAIIMSSHQMDRVEELCERICMFNHGRIVLYGNVDEVRRRWAPNAVVVQGHGDFEHVPGVERVEAVDQTLELWLDGTTTPQDVLRTLALRPDLTVERFEVARPRLDDIFIAVVEGHQRVVRRSSQMALEPVDV
jgi:ABC-2 type transport system ATP-binding protein